MRLLAFRKRLSKYNWRKGEIMLTLLFIICMFGVFGKLFFFGLKAAWGISKFILTLVFLPLILIVMVAGGLISLALPILLVIGIVGLIASKA